MKRDVTRYGADLRRRLRGGFKFVPLLALNLCLGLASAQAATFIVSNLDNDGAGSLRQAIIDANTQPGADRIEFAAGLSGVLPVAKTLKITSDVDLVGPGMDVLEVLGNGTNVFSVEDGTSIVSISGLTITSGADGIYNRGKLAVRDCDISRNFDDGIENRGNDANLTVKSSILSENGDDGIYNVSGNLACSKCTASDNEGAGIAISSGWAVIDSSTVSGNKRGGLNNSRGNLVVNNSSIVDNLLASGFGGGIYISEAPKLVIANTTVAGNQANNNCGGGAYIRASTDIAFYNNTVSGNDARFGGGLCIDVSTILSPINTTISDNNARDLGGGIYVNDKNSLLIGNSLVVGNTTTAGGESGAEIYNEDQGIFNSRGYNLFGQNGTSGLVNATPAASDLILPGLVGTAIGPLADNGGPTLTHLLVAKGPAIDAGDNGLIPIGVTTDQRGEDRIRNGRVDIGAVEVDYSPKTYKLSVSKAGKGRVTSKPAGIDCGVDCTARFATGSRVQLMATPAKGFVFTGWSGACSGAGKCVVKMNRSRSVMATFERSSPDFLIRRIKLTPASPIANGTFDAKVTVKNQGTAAADGGKLLVWGDQKAARRCGAKADGSVDVGTLAAGASKTLIFRGLGAGSVGAKTFRAFVDGDCVTAESDEDNNQATKSYRVGGSDLPDFVVTGVELTPTRPTAGDTFTVKVTVENRGTTAGDGGYLDLWSNRPKARSCADLGESWAEIGKLAAGASKTLSVPVRSGNAGAKTLRVYADSWCETKELDERNNQYTKAYRVR